MNTTYQNQVFTGTPKPVGADNHAHAVDFDRAQYLDCEFNANGASEAFKASRHRDVEVDGGVMRGGVEDCEDLVECIGFHHHGVRFERGPAQQDVTIKYQSRDCSWVACPGLRKIVAGEFSIYDYPKTGAPVSGCEVHVTPGDPKVRVWCINSEPWSGDVVNIRIPWSWLHWKVVAVYFWARRTFWKETGANAAKTQQ